MNTYQWLCVLGIPSILASSFSFIIIQFKQIRAYLVRCKLGNPFRIA